MTVADLVTGALYSVTDAGGAGKVLRLSGWESDCGYPVALFQDEEWKASGMGLKLMPANDGGWINTKDGSRGWCVEPASGGDA